MQDPQGARPLDGNAAYEFVKDLSSGAFGFVQLARHRQTKQLVAIKFLLRGPGITRMTQREICNHARLRHPHVIGFKGVFLTPKYLAIIMEAALGGNVLQFVNKHGGLTESEARWLFQQAMIGLDYVHRKGVVVRDVKLENTLLDTSPRPLVKFCDFGFTKGQDDSLPKTKLGTISYTAPEIITGSLNYDGKLADVWSAGVMLYIMLFAKYPFDVRDDDPDPRKFVNLIKSGIVKIPSHLARGPAVTEDCAHLLRRILVANPQQRLTINQIQQHVWYRRDLPAGLDTYNNEWIARQNQKPDPFDFDKISVMIKQAVQLG